MPIERYRPFNERYKPVNEFRLSGKDCDVTFLVDGKSFRCHGFILSSASQDFDEKFRNLSEECRANPFVLEGIKASTFEDILQSIYTNNIVITESNLFDMTRYSDLYAISAIQDKCVDYIRCNFSKPNENIFKIISYMKTTGIRNAVLNGVLNEYVWQHFHYFSTLEAFFELSFDDLITALQKSSLQMENQIALRAIFRWLQRPSLSPEDREIYSDQLLERCTFRDAHEEYIMKHYIKPTTVSITDGNFCDEASNHVQPSVADDGMSLNVFIKILRSPVTNIFTLRKLTNNLEWDFKCKVESSSEILKVVQHKNQLYSMTKDESTGVHFDLINADSLSSTLTLEPPPIVVNTIELCGMDRCVYMYKKDYFAEILRNRFNTFPVYNDKELSRGVYAFNCEINSWTCLPELRMRTVLGSLTCDDERGLLYLIGGCNKHDDYWGCAQAYDPRTRDWMIIPYSEGLYIDPACCFLMGKLYASGGVATSLDYKPTMVEVYDPAAGSWRSIASTRFNKDCPQLIPFEGQLWAVSNCVPISKSTNIEVYSHQYEKWSTVTSLGAAVKEFHESTKKPTLSTSIDVLDQNYIMQAVVLNSSDL